MEVYALVGASGTGKSHRASLLAYQYNIPLIIDDGLLIKGNQVLAGRSAKREATRLGAIKRAVFHDPQHARQVKERLNALHPERILILGTSRKMVDKIVERLELPLPVKYIGIEEIAPPEAIKKALEIRHRENRHVIPIPTFAIKKEFPGYLIDPILSFFMAKHPHEHQKVLLERSIVRPIYNSLGRFFISEQVIIDLVTHIAQRAPGIAQVTRVGVNSESYGVTLKLDVILIYGEKLDKTLYSLQKEVKERIEYLTGFNINAVDVTARRLHFPADKNPQENKPQRLIELKPPNTKN